VPISTPAVRIGISGWRYAPWRGVFYPPGLVQRRELEFAAGRFDTIELNGTFYSLQRPESFQRWRDATPPGFVFAVKGPRFITHMLRLRGCRVALANFFASGVLALGDKLGPVLWQLPERHEFEAGALDEFLALLPHTRAEAVTLAGEHDEKIDGRAYAPAGEDRPLRHAIEVRSASFADERFYELLRRHGIALVVADTAQRWPRFTEVTADFVYVRLHGAEELYASGYSDEQLDRWAEVIRGWGSGASCPDRLGRDVYAYFDNDAKGRAPFDALALRARLARPRGDQA
jgi:uncharacterized protein YecE (DUF72 family)